MKLEQPVKLAQIDTQRWRQIDELLQVALRLEPAQRATLLQQACARDATLRREVEALLAEAEDAGDFLATPAVKFQTGFTPDQQFGPYRLVRELGRGGMGTVWLAERSDGEFQQRVALKLVKRGMDTDEVLRRFRYERQILARLEHPHIARLYDGGATPEGLPYLVMEYIEGLSLDEYCEQQCLTVHQRLALFQQVCAAVHFAHRNLVVHRDLKPGNILVTNKGQVKLLDFGIAKLLAPSADPAQDIYTQTGQRLLTPAYASPEQVKGDVITTASDVYALGALLYRLLAGVLPYRPDNSSAPALAQAICEQEPARPSQRVTQPTLRRALAGELDAIVLKALRKEPEARYATIEQLAEDIERYLHGLPVRARAGSASYRALKFVKRQRGLVIAATLVLATLLGGIMATTREARRAQAALARAEQLRLEAESQRQRAETEQLKTQAERDRATYLLALEQAAQKRATTQRARAEQLLDEVSGLTDSMLKLHDEIAKLPNSTTARDWLIKTALKYLDGKQLDGASGSARLRTLAYAYERFGDLQSNARQTESADFAGALKSYDKALALQHTLSRLAPTRWQDRYRLVKIYQKRGWLQSLSLTTVEAASADYGRALRLLEALAKAQPQETIIRQALVGLHRAQGQLHGQRGNQTARILHTEQAQRLLESLPADKWDEKLPADDATGWAHYKLGVAARSAGDLAAALEHFQHYLARAQSVSEASPNNVLLQSPLARAWLSIGDTLFKLNKPVQAIPPLCEAIKIYENLVSQDAASLSVRRSLSRTHQRLAQTLMAAGDEALALQHFQRAITLDEISAGRKPDTTPEKLKQAAMHNNLADALRRNGNLAEALVQYRQALTLADSAARQEPTSLKVRQALSLYHYRLGDCFKQLNNTAEAVEHLQRAVALRESLAAEPGANVTAQLDPAFAYILLAELSAMRATDETTPRAVRLAHWQTARQWSEKSLALFLKLRDKGLLPAKHAAKPGELAQQLAESERALAKLQP